MASGYLTSDGKDLDSRYLAIDGKAASASKADTATTATNVANKGTISRNGDFVSFVPGTSGTYSCPAAGVVTSCTTAGASSLVYVNGVIRGYAVFCNAGDKIKSGSEGASYTLTKVRIS